MAKSRTQYPLESFGPEIMAALLKGAREEVRIKTTYRQGIIFRRRVHQLRARLRDLGHAQYPLAARAMVRLLWGKEAGLPEVENRISSRNVKFPVNPDCDAFLILSPRDSEFSEVLQKSGITASLSEDPLANSTQPAIGEPDSGDPLASFRPSEEIK